MLEVQEYRLEEVIEMLLEQGCKVEKIDRIGVDLFRVWAVTAGNITKIISMLRSKNLLRDLWDIVQEEKKPEPEKWIKWSLKT